MSVERLGVESVNSAVFNLEIFSRIIPCAWAHLARMRRSSRKRHPRVRAMCAGAPIVLHPMPSHFPESCARTVPALCLGHESIHAYAWLTRARRFGKFLIHALACMTLARRWVFKAIHACAWSTRTRVALFSSQSWFLSFKSQISYF